MIHPPVPDPVDVDGVFAVALGTVLWAVAFLVTLIPLVQDALRRHHSGWWTGACAAGVVLGLMGLLYCTRRRSAIARDRASP